MARRPRAWRHLSWRPVLTGQVLTRV
jgi:hypothetical protein